MEMQLVAHFGLTFAYGAGSTAVATLRLSFKEGAEQEEQGAGNYDSAAGC